MGRTIMKVERGFLGGFLVLGFVIFVAGFLTGMLALAMVRAESDITTLTLMWFLLGFVLGLLTIALALVIVRWNRLSKKPQQSP
jgi:hypothetical protein